MITNYDWSCEGGNEIALGYLKRALNEYNRHNEEKLSPEQMRKILSMMGYSFDLMTSEQAYQNYYSQEKCIGQ